MEDHGFKLVECPRDAMQGFSRFIPTKLKVRLINQLLKVGFHTLDFGSFVSPKHVPQMEDTEEVLNGIDISSTSTKLLAIVVNMKGVERALQFPAISFLGYPLSVSETFQRKNANQSIEGSVELANRTQELCIRNGKELVVYISMGFGNPYNDPYNQETVLTMVERLRKIGTKTFSIADTTGGAGPEEIHGLLSLLIREFDGIEFGAHLHVVPGKENEKIDAVIKAGCKRLDGALLGLGGCPFAQDKLTGNLSTEAIVSHLWSANIDIGINEEALKRAIGIATEIFKA